MWYLISWTSLLSRWKFPSNGPIARLLKYWNIHDAEPSTEKTESSSPHASGKRIEISEPNTSKNKSCKLFRTLPIEIRHQIYTLALGTHNTKPVAVTSAASSEKSDTSNAIKIRSYGAALGSYWLKDGLTNHFYSRKRLTLLLTCRQIYHEASFILYTVNTFIFSSFGALQLFARSIPLEHLRLIRRMRIEYDPGRWSRYWQGRCDMHGELEKDEGRFWKILRGEAV